MNFNQSVYVCYEENSGDLILECDSITNLHVFSSPEKAYEWFVSAIKDGIDSDFVVDDCFELSDRIHKYENNNGSIQVSVNIHIDEFTRFIKQKHGLNCTMFLEEQENWYSNYTLRIFAQNIE